MLRVSFVVKLTGQLLANFEKVALVGNHENLGSWNAHKAIIMKPTEEQNCWGAATTLPKDVLLKYRYFIAAIDSETEVVQVRRWEAHVTGRQFAATTASGYRADIFGWVEEQCCTAQRGWLETGKIVQFHIFRNALQLWEKPTPNDGIFLKLLPVSTEGLAPIMPSTMAYTECVLMSHGNSILRPQPEFGVPYKSNDTLIFHTTMSACEKVAFLLQMFLIKNNKNLSHLVGLQFIHPSNLKSSEGSFKVDLISPVWLNIVGTFKLRYLIISPMPNPTMDMSITLVGYWRDTWKLLDAGHRGLGRTLHVSGNSLPIIENTLGSVKATADLGADFVEFDVHLTSDLIPIIYHDFMVYTRCDCATTPTKRSEVTEVLIKDVTYEELKYLKTYQMVDGRLIEYGAPNGIKEEADRLFPSLEDFLTKTKKTLGFNIEVKWPQQYSNGKYEGRQTIDKNLYVDRILDVVLKHGPGRMIFFSSFDANICTMLRFKQNMYPVMFIMGSTENMYADPRSNTVYDTLNNAQAFELAGIVTNAIHIKNNTNLASVVAKQNKRLFLWGADLKDLTSINWFKKYTITGLIYDRIDTMLPKNKKSIFEIERDLPEYFKNESLPTEHTTLEC